MRGWPGVVETKKKKIQAQLEEENKDTDSYKINKNLGSVNYIYFNSFIYVRMSSNFVGMVKS